MKSMRWIPWVMIILFLVAAPASVRAGDATVGQFVQRLAAARGLDSETPQQAVDALAASGVALPGDLRLGDRLTEGTLVRLSRLFDLQVSTSSPGAGVTDTMLGRYFDVFGPEVGSDNSSHDEDDQGWGDGHQNGNGKGKGYGHGDSKGKGKGWGHGDSKGKGKGKPKSPCDPN